MQSLSWILLEVLQDCGTRCGAPTSQDRFTILRRVEYEGEAFLTITLPEFGRGFERALDQKQVVPSEFPSFGKSGCLPKFLSGFTRLIFDRHGTLLEEPCVDAIFSVRQICYTLKKLFLLCSKEKERVAERKFLKVDNEAALSMGEDPDLSGTTVDFPVELFASTGRAIVAAVFSRGETLGYDCFLLPRHGPGVNTSGALGNAKWRFTEYPRRIEQALASFPEFLRGSLGKLYECYQSALANEGPGTAGVRMSKTPADGELTSLDPELEPPVRVTFVPKTQKAPRTIAIESLVMQYAQQGVREYMVRCVETSNITSGHVNFSDQETNKDLALRSSRSGEYATIDMSDASDRVSLEHVRAMFSSHPQLLGMLEATRSSRAKLPSGDVITLRKFASMGSATCFPVEAIVFFTAIVAARLHLAKVRVCLRNIVKYSRDVFVYGDDLIVPTHEAPSIVAILEKLNFKVNSHKSFWTGKFRESCGEDAYDGWGITPVYVRQMFPRDRRDVSRIVSWVATSNQFYLAGLWRAAAAIKERIDRLIRLPLVPKDSPSVGWVTFSNVTTIQRWNQDLHRFEFRGMVVTPTKISDPLDGDAALLKCWSMIGRDDLDPDHLTRSVKRSSFALKRRWVPSY